MGRTGPFFPQAHRARAKTNRTNKSFRRNARRSPRMTLIDLALA